MSILVKDPPLVFLHIPKTGGRSVRVWLKNHCNGFDPKHKTMHMDYAWNKMYIRKAYDIDTDSILTFTVVRNPWDRIVSAYFDFLSKQEECTFQDFVLNKLHNTTFKRRMSDYVGKNTHVIRFENLKKEFTFIQDYVKVYEPLGHIGKSKRTHYSEYYDNETREYVSKMYSKDVERFNYKFEEA